MTLDDSHAAAKPTFAGLLRSHRVAAALSQEALAERSGISLRAVSDLERGVKTRPHLETVRMLSEGLELDPDARAALIAASRPIPALALTIQAPLERAHSLIGRDDEIASAIKLLTEDRLPVLTMTGPGGVGKTSLARAVVGHLAQRTGESAAWVELMPLTNPTLVAAAIAQAVDVPEDPRQPVEESLRAFLQNRRLLLVLDNCEHLRAAVADVIGDLLPRCPHLQVLATSRARLRLSAERVFAVETLALPDVAASRSDEVTASESGALFAERAQAARPEFRVDEQNAADVAAICRRLEGLPLAIELAAARIRLLSPSTLRALLEERLRVLTGGNDDAPAHHRSLEAALAWSYDLLDQRSQATLQAMAAFAGGCTFEAISAVAQSDPFAIADDLQELFDQNLIYPTTDPDGETRYITLDSVRDFGRARLRESGHEDAVRDRHAEYFLDQAERADADRAGPNQAAWLRRLDCDRDNLRDAMAWLEACDRPTELLRFGSALWSYWTRRGSWDEGRALLERAVASEEGDLALRARAFQRLGNFAIDISDYSKAGEMYTAALSLARKCGDRRAESDALNGLGIAASDTGALAEARERHLQALAIRSEIGDTVAQALSNYNLGMLALAIEDTISARKLLELSLAVHEAIGHRAEVAYSNIWLAVADMMEGALEVAGERLHISLATLRDVGDRPGQAYALIECGRLGFLQGEIQGAISFLAEALQIRSTLGDHIALIATLERLSGPAASIGYPIAAARLLGAAAAKRESLGTPATPADQRHINEAGKICAAQIGKDAFSNAVSEGRFLSEGEAIALVNRVIAGFAEGGSDTSDVANAC
jgi:predicted ATPase/DNA-binding XRE family transcriptional regulator